MVSAPNILAAILTRRRMLRKFKSLTSLGKNDKNYRPKPLESKPQSLNESIYGQEKNEYQDMDFIEIELQYYKEKYQEEIKRTQLLKEANARQEQQSQLEIERGKSQLKEANGRLDAYQEQLHETNLMIEKYKLQQDHQNYENTPRKNIIIVLSLLVPR